MHESVQQAQKTVTENSATLHDMLVGIENLAESVKQLREEVRGWEEPEVQEEMEQGNRELDELMQEVSPDIPFTVEQSQPLHQTPAVNIPVFTQPTSAPVLTPAASKPILPLRMRNYKIYRGELQL